MKSLGRLVAPMVACSFLSVVPVNAAGIWGRVQPAPGETQLPKEITVTLEIPMESFEETVSVNPEGKFFFSVSAGEFVAAYLTVRSPGYQTKQIVLSSDDRIPGVLLLSLGPRLTDAKGPKGPSAVVDASGLANVPAEAARDYEKAREALEQGELETSVDHLDRALKKHPSFPSAWTLRGVVLTRLNRHEEAESSFGKALEIAPNDSTANKYLGYLLLTTSREEEAITPLEKAVEALPSDPAVFAFLGEALFQSGRVKEALSPLEKAYEMAPDFFRVSYRLGYVYLKLGQNSRALETFRQFLKTNKGMDDTKVRALVQELEQSGNG